MGGVPWLQPAALKDKWEVRGILQGPLQIGQRTPFTPEWAQGLQLSTCPQLLSPKAIFKRLPWYRAIPTLTRTNHTYHSVTSQPQRRAAIC